MSASNIVEMSSSSSNFVTTLNAVIKKCRDILRLEGITGMDSMKHLTLYTLLRRLDTTECKKLRIPVKFSWEKFIDLKDDHQRCFDLLYCKSAATEDLISCLDNKFGTKNFNFKLNNPTHHVEILNEFKKLDFSNLDGKIDILGTIYEIHLGSGSNKSAMRDLGQFFTERDVCKYMTALCNPKVLSDGRAESVLDPTMGTGGFLSSYIQHLGNSVDWSKMHNDIAGYDIDEFVMSIGKINLYLQTGQLFERIKHRDTLSNDIGTETQRLKFKNILANMPFGVKGLTHAGCCLRVRNLKIQSTKSEPLFLQLMMASLDDGGRCAVVVPDGVLVNASKGHNETRKYLLEHFELKRVIKMKGQFFSNTGIQPSILFFENSGKPTSVTEFWEVEKNSAGLISEELIVSVPREKIDTDSYSLDMRRYVEVAVSEKVSAFPMVKLGDIGELCRNNKEIIDNDNGKYIKYFGPKIVGKCVDYQFDGEYILTPSRQSIGLFGYVHEKFNATHTYVIKITNKIILTKYVYYYLFLNSHKLKECSKGIIPYIRNDDILTLSIPHLPLETQQQIVAELDSIYDNAHKASQMASSIKTQMASVMKSVGMRGYERKKLGDLIKISKGTLQATKCDGGQFPVVSISDKWSHSTFSDHGEHVYIASVSSGASSGPFETVIKYHNGDCSSTTLMQKLDIIDVKIITYNYLFYGLNSIKNIIEHICEKGSCNKTMDIKKFMDLQIPLPPLETQQQILTILNEMEGERKSLEQMASKAEERAKFVLDGYLNSD